MLISVFNSPYFDPKKVSHIIHWKRWRENIGSIIVMDNGHQLLIKGVHRSNVAAGIEAEERMNK